MMSTLCHLYHFFSEWLFTFWPVFLLGLLCIIMCYDHDYSVSPQGKFPQGQFSSQMMLAFGSHLPTSLQVQLRAAFLFQLDPNAHGVPSPKLGWASDKHVRYKNFWKPFSLQPTVSFRSTSRLSLHPNLNPNPKNSRNLRIILWLCWQLLAMILTVAFPGIWCLIISNNYK